MKAAALVATGALVVALASARGLTATTAPQALPSVQSILDKYLAAVGGEPALKRITTRVQHGNLIAGDNKTPIDVYAKAPNKRVSVSHGASGDSMTAFDGTAGWLGGTGQQPRDMSATASQGAGLDAEFALALRITTIFQTLRSGPPEKIDDRDVAVVLASGTGVPAARLFFDAQTGLLRRLVRLDDTGGVAVQIDYADYREQDGIRIPFRWTLSRTGGSFTIQIDSVEQNVPIDDARFAKPAGGATQAPLAAHQQDLHDVYKQLVEFNTNPTNGTTAAAQAMAKRFRDAGFPDSDIFVGGPRPEKFNVVVRYHATGGSTGPKPLLLLAHLDVVEALKADWSPDLDPFVFTERDGYYYGRGTSDDKAMAAVFVANLIRLKREAFAPPRDIVVALTADEEGGGSNGAAWLVNQHRDLVDAAFVINEGGGGALRGGKPFWNALQATEKVVANFTLTTKNRGGHSSVPRTDNAIYQLAAGLARLGQFSFPVQLNDVTRAFFTRTAGIETPETAAAMRAIVANQADAAASRTLSRDPRYNSMLRTTCVATMLSGGHATNALPQTASATVNCRMLPNVPPADVRNGIVGALGDPGIEVSAAPAMNPTSPSPLLPDVLGPVEAITKDLFGPIPVIPIMGTGATDSRSFRRIGIPSYGVSGLFGDPEDVRAHGRDERMLVKSLYDGQEFLYRLTKALSK